VHIIVAHSHLAGFGGGERCTLELMRYLSRRHEVTLWAGGYLPDHTFPELANYPRREVGWNGWLTEVPRTDVVITQTFGSGLLALRHPHTLRYIHTLRSHYLRGGARPDLVLRRALDRVAVARVDTLATNSAYTAARICQRYRRDAAVVAPGVTNDLLSVPEHVGDYALYAGRLAPEKGIERTLAWTRSLPVELVVVGDGTPEYTARLRSLAGPQVRFRGALTGADLVDAYAAARFLVFTPDEEEFGLVALEAMAAAKPVIASPEGALPELVQHDVTGLLVHSADELAAAAARLLADDAPCIRLGHAARERARAYTWDRFGAAVEELCRSIQSRSGASDP
jgi:glycosyltransferase involved in cell wall biosynthesis